MIKTIMTITALLMLASPANAKRLHLEDWYVKRDCTGRTEITLSDRTRVDCLTETHATEYDFGNKYLSAIGQALHYARITGKRAEIALILEKPKDVKYLISLEADVHFYNLPIDTRVVRP